MRYILKSRYQFISIVDTFGSKLDTPMLCTRNEETIRIDCYWFIGFRYILYRYRAHLCFVHAFWDYLINYCILQCLKLMNYRNNAERNIYI